MKFAFTWIGNLLLLIFEVNEGDRLTVTDDRANTYFRIVGMPSGREGFYSITFGPEDLSVEAFCSDGTHGVFPVTKQRT
jgi:hypothetical protein